MTTISDALRDLGTALKREEIHRPVPFRDFLLTMHKEPNLVLRSVFQLFHDMIQYYVPPGVNEYPKDPESINYINYDCSKLFVEGVDQPFFADRLFANRLINHANALSRGVQQNRIYVFEGPPGTGKSTFLNNLLTRLEEYTRLNEGAMYETIWRLDIEKLGGLPKLAPSVVAEEQLEEGTNGKGNGNGGGLTFTPEMIPDKFLFVPCPSHDHPIVQIPKQHREPFLAQVIGNADTMVALKNSKRFEWVFKDEPCTICQSLHQALTDKLGSPDAVLDMLYTKRYLYDRRLGEGVSVFSPGDLVIRKPITNPVLQHLLNNLFRDSNAVRYINSRMAKTNNGVFAIMDIKNNNKDRILNLHGIISDEVHKVEFIEERINSLFLALVNPEDERTLSNVKSYRDRIVNIPMPYVLDHTTEVKIYRDKLAQDLDSHFLPGVLSNFAKVIISTRIKPKSPAIANWIKDKAKYEYVADKDLMLLKMEIYTGIIPPWVTDEDTKAFAADNRRELIGEGEIDGQSGISGRQSIQLITEFYDQASRAKHPITMEQVTRFFERQPAEIKKLIPEKFLDALNNLYDYTVLQEVKEALYAYNREQVARAVKNYLSAINYDLGTTHKGLYTGDELKVTEELFGKVELRILGKDVSDKDRQAFRHHTLREYISRTLAKQILIDNLKLEETALYKSLYDKYADSLKQNVLDPFTKNETFRMAVRDYGRKSFLSYDSRIKQDVRFLMGNLKDKFGYAEKTARWICLYVLDKGLIAKFAKK